MFHRCVPLIALVLALVASASATSAQVSKGHQVLIDRGLQLQGMVTNGDVFNLSTYQNANYTSINWIWDSNTSLQGAAPGMLWSRWVRNDSELPARPGYNEEPYLDQLFAIQVGDEANLNDPAVRDDYVARYNAIRASNPSWLPHTILWNNNFGGQVSDAALGDFIQRAQPDMIGFDTYPYKANPTTHVPNDPPHGSPWTWYSDMRRYRQHALGANIPFSVYRQTFAAIETDGGGVPVREYRALSPSEMRLQTFAALGFGAKVLTDFTYNTGASTMFDGPGDLNPTPLYNVQKEINRQAKNLGPALVRLTPIHDLRPKNAGEPSSIYVSDEPFPAGTTTNILMLRGRFDPPTTPIDPNKVNPLPIGFTADPQGQNVNSWFEVCKNDPYLSGFGRTNLGNVESPQPGDAFISWFKPVDPLYDDPNQFDDQLYFTVVNGITSPDGSADTRQRIVLDFEKTDALFRSRHGDLNAPGDFPGLLLLDSDTGNVVPVPISATQEPGTLWSVSATKWRLTLDLDGGMGTLFKFGSDPNSFIQFASPVPEPGALTLLPIAALFLRRRARGARR